jgi:cell wall-associated protease
MEGQFWNASEFGGTFESIDLEYDPNENVWVGSKTITSVDYTGKWRLEVSAKDGAGNTVYDTFPQPLYVDQNESEPVTSVNLEVNQTSPQIVGTPISVKATSEGSSNPEYRFYVRDDKGDLTTIQEYSSQDTITWTPTGPGNYTIIVQAKDKYKTGSASFYEAQNEINYTVNVGKVTSVQAEADQVSPNVVGTPITFTATSEGSNEPVYLFYVKDHKGNLTALQEYSDDNTFTWTPTSKGNYTVMVYSKDKGSKDLFEAQTEMSYKIKAGKETSVQVKANQPSSTIVGTPITLTATSEGSNKPEYRFLVKDDKGVLTTLQESCSNDTVTWTPASAGSYTIIVVLGKENGKSGSGESFEARTEMLFNVQQ